MDIFVKIELFAYSYLHYVMFFLTSHNGSFLENKKFLFKKEHEMQKIWGEEKNLKTAQNVNKTL